MSNEPYKNDPAKCNHRTFTVSKEGRGFIAKCHDCGGTNASLSLDDVLSEDGKSIIVEK